MAKYEFDGSSGCDICGAVTGKCAAKASRPHPNCKCKITKSEEDCTLIEEEYCEIPGEKYYKKNGLGPPGTFKIWYDVEQEVTCICIKTYDCVDPKTGEHYTDFDITEWEEVRPLGKYLTDMG